MTTDTEALVRRAYHLAEGDVLDVQRERRHTRGKIVLRP